MKKIQMLSAVLFMFAIVGSAVAAMGPGGNLIPGTVSMMPGGSYMQMPTTQQMVSHGATNQPVMGQDFAHTMPIGLGSIATGGNTMTMHVQTGQFVGSMDMYFMLYAPAIDPFNIYVMHQDYSLAPMNNGFTPWMSGVTGVDQVLLNNVPISMFPPGTYTLGLMATPTGGNMSTYYLWMTSFMVP